MRESVGESDTLTPTCQFACGPLLLPRPPLTLWFSCLISKLRNLSGGKKTRDERRQGQRTGGRGTDLEVGTSRLLKRSHQSGDGWFSQNNMSSSKNSSDVSWIYTRQVNVKCYTAPNSTKLARSLKCKWMQNARILHHNHVTRVWRRSLRLACNDLTVKWSAHEFLLLACGDISTHR